MPYAKPIQTRHLRLARTTPAPLQPTGSEDDTALRVLVARLVQFRWMVRIGTLAFCFFLATTLAWGPTAAVVQGEVERWGLAWGLCMVSELILVGVVWSRRACSASERRAAEGVHIAIGLAATMCCMATIAGWLTISAWAQIGLATLTWCGSMTLAAATLAATAATLDVPPSIAPRIARRVRGGLFVVLAGCLAMFALVWLTSSGSWLGADTSAGPFGMQAQGRAVFRLLNLATFAIAGYAWSAFALWGLLCDVVLWDVIRIIQPVRGNHTRG